MKPWRAGTPGRAPRNWRAVVILWRPLRLFIPLTCLLAASRPARAQSLEFRLGALYATPLIKDAVSTRAVNDSIPGTRSTSIQLQQKLAPIATLALHLPMRGKSEIEVGASVARSMVRGDDDLQNWDVANVTVGNLVMAFGYRSNVVTVHGGVGVTKLFAPETALFTSGNSIKPLAEIGAVVGTRFGRWPLHIDGRLQTHRFGTTTLRDNNGGDGSVVRAIVQVGTTVWQRVRP